MLEFYLAPLPRWSLYNYIYPMKNGFKPLVIMGMLEKENKTTISH
jgi:hypothetical protein